jgi:hypothetical protein
MQVSFHAPNELAHVDEQAYKVRQPMRRSPHDDLRLAIDMLPERTRTAMLDGVHSNDIIVGAYTDKVGGVCPMLAAHRNGGRTNFISFAKAWDAFARAKRPRKASERELRILTTMLEASLREEQRIELDGVIADHQALARTRRAREAAQTGFGWLRRPRRSEIEAVRTVVDREVELV